MLEGTFLFRDRGAIPERLKLPVPSKFLPMRKEKCTGIQKLCMNVHNSFIPNISKAGTAQVFTS